MSSSSKTLLFLVWLRCHQSKWADIWTYLGKAMLARCVCLLGWLLEAKLQTEHVPEAGPFAANDPRSEDPQNAASLPSLRCVKQQRAIDPMKKVLFMQKMRRVKGHMTAKRAMASDVLGAQHNWNHMPAQVTCMYAQLCKDTFQGKKHLSLAWDSSCGVPELQLGAGQGISLAMSADSPH